MSFSGEVKSEVKDLISGKANSLVAGLAAILACIGRFEIEEGGEYTLTLNCDNVPAATKCFTLLSKASNIRFKSDPASGLESEIRGTLRVQAGSSRVRELAQLLDLVEEKPPVRISHAGAAKNAAPGDKIRDTKGVTDWSLLADTGCIRSYIRSMFLCVGSVSDPEREYHLEFNCVSREQAEQVQSVLADCDIDVRITPRRKNFVVYSRDAEVIAAILTLMDARRSLLQFEDARVTRQVRGSVNRQVNCETANIRKTVTAAQKMIDDIHLLEESGKMQELPQGIQEIARARATYPELSLQGLGELLDPPVGKSGVNHRLRKISEAAAEVRSGM